MEIIHDAPQLRPHVPTCRRLESAVRACGVGPRPLLIDRYFRCDEIDVDCIADASKTLLPASWNIIEEAGIHSGDSASACRPIRSRPPIAELERQTRALALALNVVG